MTLKEIRAVAMAEPTKAKQVAKANELARVHALHERAHPRPQGKGGFMWATPGKYPGTG